jgi:Mrp family chromosome partitioning ATPase
MVLIDAPPVLENMDVAVFAAVPDAVLLVVESGVTSRESLVRSVQLLRGSGANLLGCILSGASQDVPRWLRRILVGPSA